MSISLGFIVITLLILLPGLLYRKLYFYGDFSKQFHTGYNLVWLLTVSSIPGMLLLLIVSIVYNYAFDTIRIDNIIDVYTQVLNDEANPYTLNKHLKNDVAPFIGFHFVCSLLIGAVSGRMVRILGVDAKFKLLRFKNSWFYLFSGKTTAIKKYKHLGTNQGKHLFTKADILVDTNSENILYSGIVVDYELSDKDCTKLDRVVLEKAKRYKLISGKRTPVSIPGTLLVVDCTNMINLNLYYAYDDKGIINQKLAMRVNILFAITFITLLPMFLFDSDLVSSEFYDSYKEHAWYYKLCCYLLAVQGLSVFNPFKQNEDDEYQYVGWGVFGIRLIIFVLLFGILWMQF